MSAYVDALKMLGRRELSEAQIRQRLTRKQHDPDAIDEAVARLREERALDDERVAGAIARSETSLRGRGKVRVRLQIERAGIAGADGRAAGRRRGVRRSTAMRTSSPRSGNACAAAKRSPTIASSSGSIAIWWDRVSTPTRR